MASSTTYSTQRHHGTAAAAVVQQQPLMTKRSKVAAIVTALFETLRSRMPTGTSQDCAVTFVARLLSVECGIPCSLVKARGGMYASNRLFVVVDMSSAAPLIVEADFASLCAIARPSDAYVQLLASFQDRVFVGTRADAERVLETVCAEAARSFVAHDMELPPWRTLPAMLRLFDVDPSDRTGARLLEAVERALRSGEVSFLPVSYREAFPALRELLASGPQAATASLIPALASSPASSTAPVTRSSTTPVMVVLEQSGLPPTGMRRSQHHPMVPVHATADCNRIETTTTTTTTTTSAVVDGRGRSRSGDDDDDQGDDYDREDDTFSPRLPPVTRSEEDLMMLGGFDDDEVDLLLRRKSGSASRTSVDEHQKHTKMAAAAAAATAAVAAAAVATHLVVPSSASPSDKDALGPAMMRSVLA